MKEIKLMRGNKEVTFKKHPTYFAVRLKQGKASNEMALEASCGCPKSEVKHVDSAITEKMDIFTVKEAKELENTTDELRKAPASDVITHMYTLDGTPGGAVIPTGTMTIQFKSDVSSSERENILAEFSLEVIEDLDYIPHGYTVRLTGASPYNPLRIALELQKRKEIASAEPDLAFQISLKHEPSDDLYREQWHLKNRGDRLGLTAGADVSAEEAWELTKGSRDIIVCVMDDAFDLEHPEFNAPGKIVAPRDFGQGDFDPNPVFEDDNHGTSCAGVAIAEENGSGVVGLAPKCAFMPVRTSGWLSDQSITALFQYAIDNHADVVSCSWSAAAWNFPLSNKMHGIIHKASTEGRRNGKGCVILFAAGNENRPLDGVTDDGQISVQGFAIHPDVIAVGASNSRDERSSYSNHGLELTICAPSNGYPGRGIVTTDRRGIKGYSSEDYTFDFGGTSSATPLTAGLAALILSINPDLSSAEVRNIIKETTDKIDLENGQYDDGHSPLYGYGRINAHRAVALAAGDSEERLPEVLFMEHRVNRPIPDLAEVEDPIVFPLEVVVKNIEVSVDIRHTWSSDLMLILKAPDEQELILQDRTGGSQDNIIKSFRSSDDPELFEPVLEKTAKGNWHLKIIDVAEQDVGVLVKWGLAITY